MSQGLTSMRLEVNGLGTVPTQDDLYLQLGLEAAQLVLPLPEGIHRRPRGLHEVKAQARLNFTFRESRRME